MFHSFAEVTEEDSEKLVCESKTKHPDLDPMHGFNECIDSLPPLVTIVRQQGEFPEK